MYKFYMKLYWGWRFDFAHWNGIPCASFLVGSDDTNTMGREIVVLRCEKFLVVALIISDIEDSYFSCLLRWGWSLFSCSTREKWRWRPMVLRVGALDILCCCSIMNVGWYWMLGRMVIFFLIILLHQTSNVSIRELWFVVGEFSTLLKIIKIISVVYCRIPRGLST